MNVASHTMTRFLFAYALVACIGWAPAARAQAEVEVFAEMGEPFTLYINQVKQNEAPGPLENKGFEETRVQFATLAHPRCTDPGNHYQAYEAFQFESSIEDLQEALGQ
jgi:hypothetical protein